VTNAQVALAWLLHQPAVTAPIFGATRVAHVEDALAAADLALDPGKLAASGIGRSLATRLLKEGFDVLGADRDAGRLAELESTGVQTLVADLAVPEDRDRVVAAGAGATALANVAGVTVLKPILAVEVEDT
jgi:hypothetical protein